MPCLGRDIIGINFHLQYEWEGIMGTSFFNTRKKQVFIVIFLVLVAIILAGYFMAEQNRARVFSGMAR